MTDLPLSGPRFALPDLAARFVVFVTLAGVVELIIETTGLRFVIRSLVVLPTGVLLAWHWPYAAGNRFVLAAVAPWLAYLAFAWSYGSSESNPPGLLRIYLLSCLLLALVAAYVARSSDAAVRGLIGVARIALLILVASVLFSHFNRPSVELDWIDISDTYRSRGFFWNPNEAALASVLFFNFVLHRPWNQRILNWFAGAAATAATLLTLSKTGVLLLFASLVLFLWLRRKWMVLAVAPVVVLLVLAPARTLVDAFQSRAATHTLSSLDPGVATAERLAGTVDLVEGNFNSESLGFKDFLWPDGIALIRDTFPLGSGFGSFHALEGSVFALEITHPVFGGIEELGGGDWYGVHNMYLLVAGEAGFAVFALLVFCCGGLLARAWFSSSRDGLPFAIIVVTLIYWCVTHSFLGNRYHVVSLAIAVGLLARRGAGERAAFDGGDAAPRRAAQQRMRGPDPAPTPATHGARTD